MLKAFLGFVLACGALIFLIAVGAAVFSGSSKANKDRSSSSSISDAETTAFAAPVMSVPALKLWIDYQANEVQADNLYRGKRLAVSGMVKQIRKDIMDDIVIELATMNEFESVDVHLAAGNAMSAAALQRGMVVHFVCDGAGMVIGSPQLKDCSFQVVAPREPDPAPRQPEYQQPESSQTSNDTETSTQPTNAATEEDERKPAPIVRQPPSEQQPQN